MSCIERVLENEIIYCYVQHATEEVTTLREELGKLRAKDAERYCIIQHITRTMLCVVSRSERLERDNNIHSLREELSAMRKVTPIYLGYYIRSCGHCVLL